jgi:hypothetical protein
LLAERDGNPGTYEIIDGLQRLHSIVSFIENSFPLVEGKFFDVSQFPTAKTAAADGAFVINKDLPLIGPKDVSTILDYSLALSIMRNATDSEVNDVFDRINTYGHRLSDQERRQAGVQNEFSTTVRELSCLLRGDISADVLPLQSMPSKGIVGSHFVKAKIADKIYSDHTTVDIEGVVRRSEIELANYELKQGLLTLAEGGGFDAQMTDKIVKTICAIANIGPKSMGKILIGVTDKKADADRAKKIDGVEPKKVGKRYVVGVNREAKRLKISVEQYFSKLKDGIKKSELTAELRDTVLSNIDFNSFYGLGVIVITVPPQSAISYVDEELYWRNGDATELATTAKQIAGVAGRFGKGA